MKIMRKIIEIDEERCDGCGQCAIACAEGAIAIVNGKAKLVSESYCDGLGACIGECPQGAITIVEREAEDFDPEEVERYLKTKKVLEQTISKSTDMSLPCGCPSTQVQSLSSSLVKNWPVKIKLVSPDAPFLNESRLFVVADCATASCPQFHERFLGPAGGVLLIGCPKFDNPEEYRQKLASIFKLHPSIERVEVIRMEVPCCSGLTGVVKKAAEDAGRKIEINEVVLSAGGAIVHKAPVVAVA